MSTYLFMALAEETSVLDSVTAPSYGSIVDAMRNVNAPPGLRLMGPSPRVTRFWNALRGTVTRVAQPVKVDDPSIHEEDVARQIVANRVYEALEGLQATRSWRPVQVIPYNEAVDGPLSFWESGQAARSTTMNEAPSVFSTAPTENPVGPNDPALRPPSAGEDLNEWLRRLGLGAGSLAPVLWMGAGLLALIYVAPAVFKLAGETISRRSPQRASARTPSR